MNLKPFSTVETHKKELYFLPVFYRIRYKIALLTCKCLYDKAPLNLQNLVTLKKTNPAYELRPEHQLCRLEVLKCLIQNIENQNLLLCMQLQMYGTIYPYPYAASKMQTFSKQG